MDASPIQTKGTVCRLTAAVQQGAGTMQSKNKLLNLRNRHLSYDVFRNQMPEKGSQNTAVATLAANSGTHFIHMSHSKYLSEIDEEEC